MRVESRRVGADSRDPTVLAARGPPDHQGTSDRGSAMGDPDVPDAETGSRTAGPDSPRAGPSSAYD